MELQPEDVVCGCFVPVEGVPKVDPKEGKKGHGSDKTPFGLIGELTNRGKIKPQHGDEQHPNGGPCESHVPRSIQSSVLYDDDGERGSSFSPRGGELAHQILKCSPSMTEAMLQVNLNRSEGLAVCADRPQDIGW